MAPQTNTFLPLLPLYPKNNINLPLRHHPRRPTPSSTLSSISTTTPSLSSSPSSALSSPSPISTTIAYAIKKLVAPSSSCNTDSPTPQTLGLYTTLDQANNTVYSLRLAYETCDPCFFWYGDGHGSQHPEISGVPPTTSKQGEFLSWEVFADVEDGGDEVGCRVWVERVELSPWDAITVQINTEDGVDGKSVTASVDGKSHWREALEPIARPCDFWGTFTVK